MAWFTTLLKRAKAVIKMKSSEYFEYIIYISSDAIFHGFVSSSPKIDILRAAKGHWQRRKDIFDVISLVRALREHALPSKQCRHRSARPCTNGVRCQKTTTCDV